MDLNRTSKSKSPKKEEGKQEASKVKKIFDLEVAYRIIIGRLRGKEKTGPDKTDKRE